MNSDTAMNNHQALVPTSGGKDSTVSDRVMDNRVALAPASVGQRNAVSDHPVVLAPALVGKHNSVSDNLNVLAPASVDNRKKLSDGEKAKIKEEKAKIAKEREAWARQRTMDEVVYNDEGTEVISVGGLPLSKFVGKMLIQFCRSNKLPVKSGFGSKANCVDLILGYKKSGPARTVIKKAVEGRKNKGTRPPSAERVGTFYRAISVILHPTCRETYLKTLSQRDRKDLDSGKIGHHAEWEALFTFYSDDTITELDSLGSNDFFVYGAGQDESSLYDELSISEFRDVVIYINFHYDKARKNKTTSGNHKDFSAFISNKGWLLFYHNRLKEIGDTDLKSAAYAELPKDVFAVSSLKSGQGTMNPSPTRRDKADVRTAAAQAIVEKNKALALFSRSETIAKREKRLEEMEDKLFDLNEEHLSLKQEGSELKRRFEQSECSDEEEVSREIKRIKKRKNHVKSKIARTNVSLSQLKKEMDYKEPSVDYSSSSDSDNFK